VSDVLIVAGEASGDRIAALTARALAAEGVRCFGVGGPSCRAAGVETIADGAQLAAMGLADVAARVPALAGGVARLALRVARERPRAALLVNYTELNQRLGRLLRARGTRVLWCVAPQVWAWRRGRLRTLGGSFDTLAVILPFEEKLWRDAGHDARYVGHPALEVPALDPATVRARLALDPAARAVAVLPGSRPGEVQRLGRPLCEAAALLAAQGAVDDARLVLAPGLDPRAREAALAAAAASGIAAVQADPEHGAASLLPGFDAALCASGTASLEAALAGAPPVVAYRMDAVAFAIARRLVRTPHVALPNVLLGRRAFPELLQDEVTPPALAAAARALLDRRDEAAGDARALRAILAPPSPEPFGARVAGLLLPWLR
jgi:lipid-A-disaccharide synthase